MNNSSHNSAVQKKLWCLCFALAFLLLFRVVGPAELREESESASAVFFRGFLEDCQSGTAHVEGSFRPSAEG